MRRRVEKSRVRYQCDICKKWYSSKNDALVCEKAKNEPQKFFKGDMVKDRLSEGYHHKRFGPIVKVKLELMDLDYRCPELEKYRHIWGYAFKCLCEECEKDRRGEQVKFCVDSDMLHYRNSAQLESMKNKTQNR